MTTHSRTHNDYHVGWICALPKEQTAATAMLDEIHPSLPKPRGSKDDNSYTLGSIRNHNIVIACLPKGRTGSVSAASVAIMMVNTFPNVKFGLMVGIGSCIPNGQKKIRLGDVVVSVPTNNFPSVVQWDMGKTDGDGEFQRIGSLNNPPSLLLTALTKLETDHELNGSKIPKYLDLLKQRFPRLAARYMRSEQLVDNLFRSDYRHVEELIAEEGNDIEFGESEYEDEDGKAANDGVCRFCDKSKIIKRKARGIKIHYGLIASGNQVVRDTKVRDKIYRGLGNNVLCIETEAAGLVDNFPCVVIRGICNYADSHWNSTWEEHAAAVAAAFARELLDHLESSEVDEESPIVQRLITIESKIEKLGSTLENKHDYEILEWLGKDYGSQQSDYIKLKEQGTGQWILDSKEFNEWFLATNSTLFSPGIPGSGKTITTAILVDYLTSLSQMDESIGVAYVFFNFKRRTEQDVHHVFASLLRQLTQRLPSRSIPETIQSLHRKHKPKGTRPTLSDITTNLPLVAAEYSKIFILMDALDECLEDGLFSKLYTQILAFQATTRVNYFATSRFIPDITRRFEKERTLEIRASDSDLRKYLENQCQCIPGIVGDEYDLRADVITRIINGVDGMFLLAKLRLESLAGMASRKEVFEALGRNEYAPAGYANAQMAYDAAYEETMDRIQSQVSSARKRAFKVLSWIVFANRPLKLLELQHALAVEKNTSALDLENLPKKSFMVGACCGLVTVDEDSDVVRLIHYTAQEYFKRTGETWFKRAQDDITEICLTYLLYDDFNKPQSPGKDLNWISTKLQLNPLYDYAARNWGYHARECSTRQENLILRFLRTPIAIISYLEAIEAYWSTQALISTQDNGLHLVAYFGLDAILIILLNQEPDLEIRDTKKQTPLLVAVMYGNETTAKLLIEKGADLEVRGGLPNLVPISWAALKGHHSIVKLLANAGANIDSKQTFYRRTALSFAAEAGNLEIVKTLLEYEVNLENKELFNEKTPFMWAAGNNHFEVVKMLLDNGADLEARDADGRSALYVAVTQGDEAMAKFLVQRGAALEVSYGKWGGTPLSWAALNGRTTSARLLIQNGANLEAKDCDGRTPLFIATAYGYEAIVRLLVESGANLGIKYQDNRALLSIAVENGHAAVLNYLLETGADPDEKDLSDRTAILLAAQHGHEELLEILINKGADVNVRDKGYSRTPLGWAAYYGYGGMIKLLIANGADIEARDRDRRTPLSLAAHGRQEAAVKLLEDSGADLAGRYFHE